jgi:hypothetical protein
MNRTAAILATIAGVSAGGAVMFFTDPDRGRRRRRMVRDRATSVWKDTADVVGKRSRDIANRARGVAASARSTVEREAKPPDNKLADRVRSRIGHMISHPGAIEVSARDGVVILSGSILADEVKDLIRGASDVRGVHHVENRLSVHRSAEGVPELQGEGRPQREWPGTLRTIMGVTGGALTVYGIRRRHEALGRMASIVGTGLLAQRIANEKLRKIIRMAA